MFSRMKTIDSGYKLSRRSLSRLKGVHPDLVAVVERAIKITQVDFAVIQGVRTYAEQRKLVRSGASKTMNSRHLPKVPKEGGEAVSHAVDIAPYIDGKIRWDWPPFYPMAEAMKQASKELGIPLEWGGDWTSFKDGPHFQLPWKDYP